MEGVFDGLFYVNQQNEIHYDADGVFAEKIQQTFINDSRFTLRIPIEIFWIFLVLERNRKNN